MPTKGYCYDKGRALKPYKVSLWSYNKHIYIGHYATIPEAIAAYKEARAKYPIKPNPGSLGKARSHQKRTRCMYCAGEYVEKNIERHYQFCKWRKTTRAEI